MARWGGPQLLWALLALASVLCAAAPSGKRMPFASYRNCQDCVEVIAPAWAMQRKQTNILMRAPCDACVGGLWSGGAPRTGWGWGCGCGWGWVRGGALGAAALLHALVVVSRAPRSRACVRARRRGTAGAPCAGGAAGSRTAAAWAAMTCGTWPRPRRRSWTGRRSMSSCTAARRRLCTSRTASARAVAGRPARSWRARRPRSRAPRQR